jgi:hypothetical protein
LRNPRDIEFKDFTILRMNTKLTPEFTKFEVLEGKNLDLLKKIVDYTQNLVDDYLSAHL